MRTVILLALLSLCTGCAFLFPKNKLSEYKKDSDLEVSFEYLTGEEEALTTCSPGILATALPTLAKEDRTTPTTRTLGILATALPTLVEFAIKKTSDELKKEAKKYTANYSRSESDDKFYFHRTINANQVTDKANQVTDKANQVTDKANPVTDKANPATDKANPATDKANLVTDIGLSKIKLKRIIRDPENEQKDLSCFTLDLVVTKSRDRSCIRLVPDPKTFHLYYSKNKVPYSSSWRPWTWFIGDYKWYKPWTWATEDNDIDMTINVRLTAVWVDDKQVSHQVTIGETKLDLKDIKLEGKDPKYSVKNQKKLGHLSTDWLPAVPLSYSKNPSFETLPSGNFTVSVGVTEYDDFEKRITKSYEYIDSNNEDIQKKILEKVNLQ